MNRIRYWLLRKLAGKGVHLCTCVTHVCTSEIGTQRTFTTSAALTTIWDNPSDAIHDSWTK